MKAKELTGFSDFSVVYRRRDYEYNMETFHYHDSYEIYILEEGKRTLFIGDKIYETVPGDTALFSPNIFHYSKGCSSHAGTCISFCESYIDRYFSAEAKKLLLDCFKRDMITLNEKETALIKQAINKMSENKDMAFVCLAEILEMLNDNIIHRVQKESMASDKGISPILLYINENYGTISGLDEIAGRFFLSKCYLCRKFKSDTGLTITKYLNHIRVQKSCEMLSVTDMSIAEISNACGYDSQAYYSRVFRHIMNCSPLEFRARTRNTTKEFEI